MKKQSDAEKFLIYKRALRFVRKRAAEEELKRLRFQKKNIDGDKEIQGSIAIDYLSRRPKKRNLVNTHKIQFVVPEDFSIINNPVGSISTVCDLAYRIKKTKKPRSLRIDHSKLVSVDLAAESILDVLVIEFKAVFRRKLRSPEISGILPNNEKIKRYLKAVGIVKNLNISNAALFEKDDEKLRILRLRNHRLENRDTLGVADYKEKSVADFVDHINRCLNDHKFELNRFGKKCLAAYTGEILANAEEHSVRGDWYIAGYLDNSYPPHFCEIAIFNFGESIYETFSKLDDDHFSKQAIKPYIAAHGRKALFSENWKEEDLVTLAAIQDGVSSKNNSEHDTRGHGTVDIIEFFQKVFDECKHRDCKTKPQMCIVSGGTYIHFDGRYRMRENKEGRKIIAFNDKNTLDLKPDSRYIRNMSGTEFPGTIISIKFPLHIEKTQLASAL